MKWETIRPFATLLMLAVVLSVRIVRIALAQLLTLEQRMQQPKRKGGVSCAG